VDGDGDFDIIAARPRGGPGISGLNLAQVVLYQNAGDGTFDERAYKPLDGDVVEFPFTDRLPIALADLGGTGHPVIIGLSLGNHPIYVIENGTSDATSFEDWYVRTVFMLPPGTPVGLVSAELDANPGPDLAMLKKLTEHGVTTGMVNVLPNVDGQLVSHTSEGTSLFDYTLGAAVGLGINAGDVDNDGLIDLVAAAGPENSITVLRNFFAREFRPAVSLSVSTEPADIYVGNLDWDTRPEIAVSHRGTTDVWVLHVRPEPVSQDCNINNRPDSCDIRDNPGLDADHDGVLDSCGGPLPPRVLSTPRWLP
jgi:hypothetical protein